MTACIDEHFATVERLIRCENGSSKQFPGCSLFGDFARAGCGRNEGRARTLDDHGRRSPLAALPAAASRAAFASLAAGAAARTATARAARGGCLRWGRFGTARGDDGEGAGERREIDGRRHDVQVKPFHAVIVREEPAWRMTWVANAVRVSTHRWALVKETAMKIFIDSGDLAEIKEAQAMGVIDGVTTNPSLLAKAGKPTRTVIAEICAVVDGPISAEVVSTDFEGILREGRELAKIHKNVVVKVPLIEDGLKAVRVFTQEGIKTNVTLCFSAPQALLSAKAGATYISPFVGRIDDIAGDGMDLIGQIVQIYKNYNFTTEVLTASVRHPVHFVQAAMIGAHVATVPLKVIKQLLKHPLTDLGLAQFLADAKKIPQA